jgi:hypothetical protein
MITPIRDWGDAMMQSLTAALALFVSAIPRAIGFMVILAIGWFVAYLIAQALAAGLRAVRFNDLAARSGFASFVESMGVGIDPAGFLGLVTKWFVRLIALVVAFDALGLPAVSDVLRQLLLWLPNLVVALVVLVIGGLAANALSSVVRGAAARSELGDPDFLSTIAKVGVWAFAIVVAVNQLGIASTLINTLFMATVGAVALAVGLAFGLGGRDVAAQIVRDWYERSHGAGAKLEKAARVAGQEARERIDDGLRTDNRTIGRH